MKKDLTRKILSLALASSIIFNTTGCKSNTEPTEKQQEATIELSSSNIDEKEKEILKKYVDNGIFTSKEKELDYFYKVTSLNSRLVQDTKKFGEYTEETAVLKYDDTCLPSEFSKYIGETNVSWDDIINTINSNDNIDKTVKDILINGINNLDKNVYNYNLSVLNYNLSKLKVSYIDYNVIKEIDDAGSFNAFDKTIRIQKYMLSTNSLDTLLLHEILGHGSQETLYEDENGKRIYVTNCPLMVYPSDSYETSYMEKKGLAFNEAFAEKIAVDASKKKMVFGEGYQANLYYANLFFNSLDGDFNKFVEQGHNYIVDLCSSNNNTYYNYYIADMDRQVKYSQYQGALAGNGEQLKHFASDLALLIYTLMDSLYEQGLSEEEIINKLLGAAKSNDKYMEYYDGRGILTFTNQGSPLLIDVNELYKTINSYFDQTKKNNK